jgi:hypothetical protein
MNLKKILVPAIVVGIVANVFDFLAHGVILQGYYMGFTIFNQDAPMGWLIFGDFVAALVFVWVYDRVLGSFSADLKGGATYGLYAGILVNFPTWIFSSILFTGFTYGLAWVWTIVGILWGVVNGAVAGAMFKKAAAKS